jgi:predicted Zn finger-like uncharacterized protein
MHTRCPHCQTIFRIAEHELRTARGWVRCGVCDGTFDARIALQKELPLADVGSQSEFDLEPGPSKDLVTGLRLSDLSEPPRARRLTRAGLAGWAAANLVLLVALSGQLLFVQREAFAQDPTLRPVLVRMCGVVGCELPARRSIDRIDLLRRNVYAHPNVEDALIVDLSFVNDAGFAQPYPVLTVSLGDLRGEALIRRHFRPSEYLPGIDPDAYMTPGAPVNVTLEVHDPGPATRTFEIDFS